MTTVLAIFCIALIFSLLLTPLSARIGKAFGAIDIPGERKVHTTPIPRTGGLAIFASFVLTLVLSRFLMTLVTQQLIFDRQSMFFTAGALVAFGVGLADDFRGLGPRTKFVFQIIGASIAFWGGVRIVNFHFGGFELDFGIVSYLATVFWFVLFINAVNLVDGLDGLAGGVICFASTVMVILAILKDQFLMAMVFAALSGSVLGFLRYNFNPASIFLGDGGSYLLGYLIAGLSVIGSVKSQVGAAMMIPVLALGIPLFDTILSPLRRFVRGKNMFFPDKGHIHHRLLEMGFTTRKAVTILYGATFGLCVLAVLIVNLRDERAGLFLIVLGAFAVVFVRKLGYLDYLASDKIFGWFMDLTDEMGVSRERRSFLSLQIDLSQSADLEELWSCMTQILNMLEFDRGDLYLFERGEQQEASFLFGCETRYQTWLRSPSAYLHQQSLLRIELPLIGQDKVRLGMLILTKDVYSNPMSHYTLKRVEHLRRNIIRCLEKRMAKNLDRRDG